MQTLQQSQSFISIKSGPIFIIFEILVQNGELNVFAKYYQNQPERVLQKTSLFEGNTPNKKSLATKK